MMDRTKTRISGLVQNYKKLFPDEYATIIEQLKEQRASQINVFATTEKDSIIEQKLYEVPETLFTIFQTNLSPQEKEELRTNRGARWFAKTFKEFAIAEKI